MAVISIVHTETHDETKPAGSRARSLGDDDIREFKRAIRERLAIDHEFAEDETGNTGIGIHKKVTMKVLASDPTNYTDVGYVYLKTVSGAIELFYQDSVGNVLQITSGGKILLDNGRLTNNVYLKAKNAAGSGTVDLIKANASDKPVLPDGSQLASSAAPSADADIANKKYVDEKVAAVPAQVGFGTWASKSGDTIYQAATDGFVVAVQGTGQLTGYTDSNANPTTERVRSYNEVNSSSVTFPVKKNDYWKVTGNPGSVYWLPLGS